MPLGKLAPTLINIANRYIYHIGGIEHENSIFMYDTFIKGKQERKWILINIDTKGSLLASRLLSGHNDEEIVEETKEELVNIEGDLSIEREDSEMISAGSGGNMGP